MILSTKRVIKDMMKKKILFMFILILPSILIYIFFYFFFFNDTATTEIYTLSYTLSLHDALPISPVTFRNLVCRLLLVTGEIGRAHVRTPVTFRNLVCRI